MNKFVSRKLIVTLVLAVLMAINERVGLNIPAEGLVGLSGAVAAYVLAQGHVDKAEPPSQDK